MSRGRRRHSPAFKAKVATTSGPRRRPGLFRSGVWCQLGYLDEPGFLVLLIAAILFACSEVTACGPPFTT